MRKLTTAVLIIALMAGSASCEKELIGNGPVITETRTITGFTGINLQMNGNVYYTKDTVWKVEIVAKESIHSMLETRVINNNLVIRYWNGKTYDADESIRINVSGPAVNRFELNTSGSIFSMDDIQNENLVLHSSGSGSISLKHITVNNLYAESNVSGSITAMGGAAINEQLKTDGSGTIDMGSVAARNVATHIIGSGDTRVKVSDHLNATIDGSGSVFFRGYPSISTNISGRGRLIRF